MGLSLEDPLRRALSMVFPQGHNDDGQSRMTGAEVELTRGTGFQSLRVRKNPSRKKNYTDVKNSRSAVKPSAKLL